MVMFPQHHIHPSLSLESPGDTGGPAANCRVPGDGCLCYSLLPHAQKSVTLLRTNINKTLHQNYWFFFSSCFPPKWFCTVVLYTKIYVLVVWSLFVESRKHSPRLKEGKRSKELSFVILCHFGVHFILQVLQLGPTNLHVQSRALIKLNKLK